MFPFLGFIFSLLITVGLVPPLIGIAQRYELFDRPGGRKAHASPVPRLGGMAMAVGMSFPVFLWSELTPALKSVLIGMAVLTAAGLIDDLLSLDWKKKLFVQVAVGLFVVLWGKVRIVFIGFWWGREVFLPEWLSIPLSLLFIVGVTNAVNLADGLDGLAAGISLFIFGLLAFLAFLQDNYTYLVPIAAIAGGVCGFLRFNTYPALIFMGDAGSYLLGFSAAVFSILCTQIPGSAVAPTIVLLILGIPVVDTLIVIVERILNGRSPFDPDRRHIHYRLMRLGFTHQEAVVVIYLVQAVLACLTFLFAFHPDVYVVSAFGFLFVVTGGGLYLATMRNWRFKRNRSAVHDAGKSVDRFAGLFTRLSWSTITVLLCLYLAGTSVIVTPIPGFRKMWWALLLIPFVLVPCYRWRRRWFYALSRMVLYILLGLVTVSVSESQEFLKNPWLLRGAFGFIAVLGIATFFYVKYSEPKAFGGSSYDALIVLCTTSLLLLPLQNGYLQDLAPLLVSMMVLFFSVEVALSTGNNGWKLIHSVAAGSAVIMGLKGFL